MIAIDTNVLLRYLLQDDDEQWASAYALITGSELVLVTDTVLIETIWTLAGKKYGLSRDDISNTVHQLFYEPQLVFEDGQAVWGALKDFVNAKPISRKRQADFQDALIVNKAQRYGQLNGVKVDPVYTFDQAALEIKGTSLPQ